MITSLANMTHEQHVVFSAWCMYGARHFVDRRGPRRWTVAVEFKCPTQFTTCRAAVEYAEQAIHEYIHHQEA